MKQEKWDRRFLEVAKLVSTWSKDPSTKVGAVIVNSYQRIVSTGFNGFARGIADDGRLEDRSTKNKIVIHAEANALLFAVKAGQGVEGCTMYIHKSLPCGPCAALIIQAGITAVVVPQLEYSEPETERRWAEDHSLAEQMFREVGMHVRMYEGTL